MEELLSHCPRWVLPVGASAPVCRVRRAGLHVPAGPAGPVVPGAAGQSGGRPLQPPSPGAESDRDGDFVRDWCAGRDIPFVSGSGDVRGLAEREGLSLEEAARKLRYDFLRQEAEKLGQHIKIYTAHHADDNAETILFQPDPGHRRGGPYRHGLPAKRHLPATAGRDKGRAGGLRRRPPHPPRGGHHQRRPRRRGPKLPPAGGHAPLEADQPQSCGAHQRRRTPPAGGGPITGGRGRPPYCPMWRCRRGG